MVLRITRLDMPLPHLPRRIDLQWQARDLYEYLDSKCLDELSYLPYKEAEKLDRVARRARARYVRRCAYITEPSEIPLEAAA